MNILLNDKNIIYQAKFKDQLSFATRFPTYTMYTIVSQLIANICLTNC